MTASATAICEAAALAFGGASSLDDITPTSLGVLASEVDYTAEEFDRRLRALGSATEIVPVLTAVQSSEKAR